MIFSKIIYSEIGDFPCIIEIDLYVVSFETFQTRVTRFGAEVGQIGPEWDKSGTFSDQIQYIWLAFIEMIWNIQIDTHSHCTLFISIYEIYRPPAPTMCTFALVHGNLCFPITVHLAGYYCLDVKIKQSEET